MLTLAIFLHFCDEHVSHHSPVLLQELAFPSNLGLAQLSGGRGGGCFVVVVVVAYLVQECTTFDTCAATGNRFSGSRGTGKQLPPPPPPPPSPKIS